jgi:pantoate kinase
MLSVNESVYVPVHVTGFFKPCITNDPLTTGSIGVGLVLEPGLKCTVSITNSSSRAVYFNGYRISIKPVNTLLDMLKLNSVRVYFESYAPIGFGYGVSGASTLALALAILNGKHEYYRAAQLAHVAEVLCLTGLGDVSAIFSGAMLAVRVRPGAPGIGEVKSLNVNNHVKILTVDLKPKHTRDMLTTLADRIDRYGLKMYRCFMENPSLESFLELSRIFAEKVGFITNDINEALRNIVNMVIGYTVKKGVLLLAVDEDAAYDVFHRVRENFRMVRIFDLGGGVRVMGNVEAEQTLEV